MNTWYHQDFSILGLFFLAGPWIQKMIIEVNIGKPYQSFVTYMFRSLFVGKILFFPQKIIFRLFLII